MKLIARILTLLILVTSTVYFTSCDDGGDDDKKSEKELQMEKLVGTWNAQAVTYDGDDMMADYGSFQLTIAKASADAMTYTVSGRPEKLTPWPASGTFTLGTPLTSQLLRDDNVSIVYAVNANTLTLTLENYSGTGYNGRTNTVAGDWVFTLTK